MRHVNKTKIKVYEKGIKRFCTGLAQVAPRRH